MEPTNTAMRR